MSRSVGRLKNDEISKTPPQTRFIGQFTSDCSPTFYYAYFGTDCYKAPHSDSALEIIYRLQRLQNQLQSF